MEQPNRKLSVCCKLSALLHGFMVIEPRCDVVITGLCMDSRRIKAGDLFVALKGARFDGTAFIQQALAHSAAAILSEAEGDVPRVEWLQAPDQRQVPWLQLPNLDEQLGHIAARFFGNPSAQVKIFGITGTNGKTSCSHYLARSLEMAGLPCGVIGTLGSGFVDHLQAGIHTTPDPITLQAELSRLKGLGAQAVAMEVSSHGLSQQRANGVEFDLAVFTNLTRDHLDYHGDMAQYAQAKRLLFTQPGLQYAVINVDDEYGRQLAEEFKNKLQVYAYSLQRKEYGSFPLVTADQVKFNAQGFRARVQTPWGNGLLRSQLLGRFNLYNLLAVLTTLGILRVPLADALAYLAALPNATGRMEAFGGGKLPLVVVDYAHTPDALEQALLALREHCQNQLWCVFGCGGDRDRGKRALMGKIAERYSDQLMITDDNPRHEDPQQIVNEIVSGLLCPWAAEIEHDRQAAIAHALDCAQAGDVVLIAGKGHETYQIIGDERLPFSDAEKVRQQLALKRQE